MIRLCLNTMICAVFPLLAALIHPSSAMAKRVAEQPASTSIEILDRQKIDELTDNVLDGILNDRVTMISFSIDIVQIYELGFQPYKIHFYNPPESEFQTRRVWMEIHFLKPSGAPFPAPVFFNVTNFDGWTIPIQGLSSLYAPAVTPNSSPR